MVPVHGDGEFGLSIHVDSVLKQMQWVSDSSAHTAYIY